MKAIFFELKTNYMRNTEAFAGKLYYTVTLLYGSWINSSGVAHVERMEVYLACMFHLHNRKNPTDI